MSRVNRGDLLDLNVPTTCLITSTYVRGLPLCGKSKRGPDRTHRRAELERQIADMVGQFSICLLNQATLRDRAELLVRTRPDLARNWSDEDVIRRACRVFRYTFRRKGVRDGSPTAEQLQRFASDTALVATMRDRLRDPSWLMRKLMWKLAWDSNREDQVRGHFVACRFDLRVVTDEFGTLASGLAVDLRQIDAQEASTPADSEHTSAGMRIAANHVTAIGEPDAHPLAAHLARIGRLELDVDVEADVLQSSRADDSPSRRACDDPHLNLELRDYLQLLGAFAQRQGDPSGPIDWGSVAGDIGICPELLEHAVRNLDEVYTFAVGRAATLADLSQRLRGRWRGQVQQIGEIERRLMGLPNPKFPA